MVEFNGEGRAREIFSKKLRLVLYYDNPWYYFVNYGIVN